jgi:hypothetical protein
MKREIIKDERKRERKTSKRGRKRGEKVRKVKP